MFGFPSKERKPENSFPLKENILILFGKGYWSDYKLDRDFRLKDQVRDRVANRLVKGEFSHEEIRSALRNVFDPTTISNHDGDTMIILAEKKVGKVVKQVLSLMLYGDPARVGEINGSSVVDFFSVSPTPLDYAKRVKSILRHLRRKEDAKIHEYQKLFDTFGQSMYGRGFDVYSELQTLVNELDKKSPDLAKICKTKQEFAETSTNLMGDQEVKNVFSKSEIHGGNFFGKILTKKELESNGLTPKYRVEMKDVDVYLSKSFSLGDERVAVIAYVKDAEGLVARTFYRSGSQGVWRYLPFYTASEGTVNWYGKGYKESSVDLPLALQKVLSSPVISAHVEPVADGQFIGIGTARNYFAAEDITMFREVQKEPVRLLKNDTGKAGKELPERVALTKRDQPDFSNLVDSWGPVPIRDLRSGEATHEIYYEVFLSKDRKLRFLMCSDQDGRAWVGSIENESIIQSTGLRNQWIDAGDLTTPVDEYVQQAGGYGNANQMKKRYVDMYQRYLSNVPLIKTYVETRGIRKRVRRFAQTPIGEPTPDMEFLRFTKSDTSGMVQSFNRVTREQEEARVVGGGDAELDNRGMPMYGTDARMRVQEEMDNHIGQRAEKARIKTFADFFTVAHSLYVELHNVIGQLRESPETHGEYVKFEQRLIDRLYYGYVGHVFVRRLGGSFGMSEDEIDVYDSTLDDKTLPAEREAHEFARIEAREIFSGLIRSEIEKDESLRKSLSLDFYKNHQKALFFFNLQNAFKELEVIKQEVRRLRRKNAI